MAYILGCKYSAGHEVGAGRPTVAQGGSRPSSIVYVLLCKSSAGLKVGAGSSVELAIIGARQDPY